MEDHSDAWTHSIARDHAGAIIGNLAACIRSFGTLAGADLHHDLHLTWVLTDIPYSFFNAVAGMRLTDAAMQDARDRGYEVATLQSSPSAIGVYQQLGFREECVLSACVLVD